MALQAPRRNGGDGAQDGGSKLGDGACAVSAISPDAGLGKPNLTGVPAPRIAVPVAIGRARGALACSPRSQPLYDPWAWLIWGRELVHLDLDTGAGPSWKPLPALIDARCSRRPAARLRSCGSFDRAGGLAGRRRARLPPRLAAGVPRQRRQRPRGPLRRAAGRRRAASPALLAGDRARPAVRPVHRVDAAVRGRAVGAAAGRARPRRDRPRALAPARSGARARPRRGAAAPGDVAAAGRSTGSALWRGRLGCAAGSLGGRGRRPGRSGWSPTCSAPATRSPAPSGRARPPATPLHEAVEAIGRALEHAPGGALGRGRRVLWRQRVAPRASASSSVLGAGALAWIAIVAVLAGAGYAGLPRFAAPAAAVVVRARGGRAGARGARLSTGHAAAERRSRWPAVAARGARDPGAVSAAPRDPGRARRRGGLRSLASTASSALAGDGRCRAPRRLPAGQRRPTS